LRAPSNLSFECLRIDQLEPFVSDVDEVQKTFAAFPLHIAAFVSSLSGYIFDTVISGNFDPFLARLSSGDSGLAISSPSERSFEFADVFELANVILPS